MRKKITLLCLVLSCSCLLNFSFVSAQISFWPGDVTDNGVVNGKDVLPWGYAFGETGPARADNGTVWAPVSLAQGWGQTFPNGADLALADCDGDGEADLDDARQVIHQHFGKTHGVVQPDHCPLGTQNANPEFKITAGLPSYPPGARIDLQLSLGSASLPLEDFHGIALRIDYNRDLVKPGAVTYTPAENVWYDPGGAASYTFFHNDKNDGVIEIAVTRLNQSGAGGSGVLGVLTIILRGNIDIVLPGALNLEISQVQLVNADLEILPVYYEPVLSVVVSGETPNTSCPTVIEPVCGSDGNTYINACYAEAAGITEYTPGVCFSECIDPAQMSPPGDCEAVIEPVCGCNNITYSNPCLAEAAGVTYYSPGPCNDGAEDQSCYDPTLVVQSSGTSVDNNSGIITLDCPPAYEPVCGCNGITYPNACTAEASGIAVYTAGICNESCVDPAAMDPDASCPNVYEPVCGCNGLTYSNACKAGSAGVVAYTAGPCLGTSDWCSEAIPVQCGDFLAQETTTGAGDQISRYTGCSPQNYQGPDRVYVFDKTTAGDLQIGLKILSPDLDLDLFLLQGNCQELICIGSSTKNNKNSNYEEILLEDAPLGTYYIAVDARSAGGAGNFSLEVNCGYLYCGEALALECGQPFVYNNGFGRDDVSFYACTENALRVENNGPEVVHFFTTTTAGNVDIQLTGLSANLELYLLGDCDRGECLGSSQNPGTGNESLSAFLEAGTYYLIVDGFNGASSDYNLLVNCTNTCALEMESVTATVSSCGAGNGAIEVISSGGTPAFLVNYSGPVSGSFATSDNNFFIDFLPPGNYRIKMIDARGCIAEETVTLGSAGNLAATVAVSNAVCNEPGALDISVQNGVPPFFVFLSGPEDRNLSSDQADFRIEDLGIGDYSVLLVDNNGCSLTKKVTIQEMPTNFSFDLTPHPAGCGELGYVEVVTQNGAAPYTVKITGPISANVMAEVDVFSIQQLAGGTYQITLVDDNQCSFTGNFTIGNINLEVNTAVKNGSCGFNGEVEVQITNGTPGFTINWTGPVEGSASTGEEVYIIEDLPSGSYQIEVEDAGQCTGFDIAVVNNSGAMLATEVLAVDGQCGDPGALRVQIANGAAPYQVVWEGPSGGTMETASTSFGIPDLAEGLYDVVITDQNNCRDGHQVFVSQELNVAIDLTGNNGNCGQDGAILVDITQGQPGYIISWNGPASGTETISGDLYEINELPSGLYQISVTDAGGCTGTAEIEIVNAEGVLQLDPTVQAANCEQDGGIGLNVSGGQAEYEISWEGPVSGLAQSDAAGNLQIDGLPAGSYQLIAVDKNGCTGTRTVTVNAEGGDLGISLTAVDPVCTENGAIMVSILGGFPDYSVSWEGPVNGVSNLNPSNFSIPDLPAGTYKVTVTDIFGCKAVDNVTLVLRGGLAITAGAVNAACGKGDIQLTIEQGTPAYDISWEGPVSGSAATDNSIYTIPDLPDGLYDISVLDVNGCIDETTIKIFSGSLPEMVATTQPGLCGNNGSIGVSISGGAPAFTIKWTGPADGTHNLNGNFYNIPDLPAGSYTILLTDNNGCTEEKIVALTSGLTELEASVQGNDGTCLKAPSIAVEILSGSPEFTISWSGPVSGDVTTGDPQYLIDGLVAGSYEITIADAGGCEQIYDLELQTGDNDLEVVAETQQNNCGEVGFVNININGGAPYYLLNWSGPVSGSTSTNLNTFTLGNLPGGIYNLTVTDQNGCMRALEVDLEIKVGFEATLTEVRGSCGSLSSILIDLNGQPPYSINWSGPGAGAAEVDGDAYEIPDLAGGVYGIMITDSKNCVYSGSVPVQVIENDLDFVLVTEEGACDLPGAITVDISGGAPDYLIQWESPEVQDMITVSNSLHTISGLPGGNYSVTVTDEAGCEKVKTIELVSYGNTVTLSTSTVQPSCDTKGSITVTVAGDYPGFDLKWSGKSSGSATTSAGDYLIPGLEAGSYTIEIADQHGCMRSATVILEEFVGFPDAGFTYAPGKNLGLNFSPVSPGDSYFWEFGDGNTSNEANPFNDFCDPGAYTVCLTLTNECGTDQYCEDVTITIPDDVAILDVGEEMAPIGGTVQVPVTIDQCPILVSLGGSLLVDDPAVAQITGLVPGVINPDFNLAAGTFSFAINGNGAITVEPGEILFYIELQAVGAPGESSVIRLTDNPIAVEVGGWGDGQPAIKPHVTLKGLVSIAETANIAGQITTFWGAPVPGAEVIAASPGLEWTDLTDQQGNFFLPELETGKEYSITAGKNTFPFNGLSTYALFVGQQFILGMEPQEITSPYQIIAGDADCNGSFSTLDLFIIQQLIVGTTEAFNYCPSWVFVSSDNQLPADFDAYNVFPYDDFQVFNLENDASANFVGVKVGDILGQADPEAFTVKPEPEVRDPVYLELKASGRSVRAGEEFEIPVTCSNFTDIVSYQFGLDFDGQHLEFTGFSRGSGQELGNVAAGATLAEKGRLNLSWFNARGEGVNADPEEALFSLKFKALNDLDNLDGLMDIRELPLRAEAHTATGDRYKIRLEWTESDQDLPLEELPFKVHQNTPNPSRTITDIRIDLPEAYRVELILHDNLGRVVHQQFENFGAGSNRLTLPTDRLSGGVYFYTVNAGPFTASLPMIINK